MKNRARVVQLYIANFFFSLHYAVILYINSSFLSKELGPEMMAALFMAGAMWSIFFFAYAPSIIERAGAKRFFIYALTLEYLALAGLIGASSPATIAISFIIYGAVVLLIPLSLDIFLEAYSRESATGRIRGANLTIGNFAIFVAPLVVAVLAYDGHLQLVYLASALLLLPLIFLAFIFKRLPKAFHGNNHHFERLLRIWGEDKDMRRVTFVRLSLEVFYTVMVIYTPLYLHETIGFSWHTIGLIFAVMLTPFVLFQKPIGYLADLYFGEKEMMTAGLFLSAAALLIMPFLAGSALAWALTLFLSRVGAATIEVTTESYFFKRVTMDDAGLISVFRVTRPVSVLIGALFGMIIVGIYSYTTLFLCLAAVLALTSIFSLLLKDTR